ncbi:MAG: VOC family protein [Clostridiales bacterium]|nr:VOC family protein [Clostridiales bacterium]
MRFNKLVPELSVSDIEVSKRFYTDVLGFRKHRVINKPGTSAKKGAVSLF